MNFILLPLLLLLTSAMTVAQSNGIYIDRTGIPREQAYQNKVKSIRVYRKSSAHTTDDTLGVFMIEQRYDRNGNRVEEIYSDQYDVGRTVYKYDKKGKEIEEKTFDRKGRIFYIHTPEKHTDYDSTGKIEGYSTYKYDKDGRMISQSMYDENGVRYDLIEHKYDERGNEIEERFEDGTGDVRKFIYDINGNILKEMNGTREVAIYKYDKKNKLTEEHRKTSTQDFTCHYTYNSNGYLSKLFFSNANDEYCCSNQEYFYNTHDLLIKKIEINALKKNDVAIEHYIYSFF
jgi:hypothetical protein